MQKLKFIDPNSAEQGAENSQSMKAGLDKEACLKLEKSLHNRYLAYLDSETFRVESHYSKSQAQLRITLESLNGESVYPIETVVVTEDSEGFTSVPEAEIAAMVDLQDSYWANYLEGDRDVFVPLNWDTHTLNDVQVYIRGFERNAALINEADKLLQEGGHGQYQIDPIGSET